MLLKILQQGCDRSQFSGSRAVTGLQNEALASPFFQTEGPQGSHRPYHRIVRSGKEPRGTHRVSTALDI